MQFKFKKLFYTLPLLLALNLQGMKNSNKPGKFSKHFTAQNESKESIFKSTFQAIFSYGPTAYTYFWPIARFIADLPRTSTHPRLLFIKSQELASKQRDFSPEFLQSAMSIMINLGIEPSSLIFCHNNNYIRNIAGLSKDAPASTDSNGIFRYSDDFLKYPLDIQTFSFAHECIHFKEKHNLLLDCAGVAMPFITSYGIKGYQWMANRVINYCIKKYNLENNTTIQNCIYAHNAIINSGLFHALLTGLVHNQLARYSEMRADIGAVKILNSAIGGIKLFTMDKEFVDSTLQNCDRVKSLLFKSIVFCVQAIDSHPSYSTRLAYLTKLQKQFENKQLN